MQLELRASACNCVQRIRCVQLRWGWSHLALEPPEMLGARSADAQRLLVPLDMAVHRIHVLYSAAGRVHRQALEYNST